MQDISKITKTPIKFGVAESGDDFTKFSTIYQWFKTLIHPALMQRLKFYIQFIT
ncbi:hypothetical protein RintRC_5366 [Richelia intracellularis]|nr:hypothetical protein RintRC_5366 [Richelia intracellularis]